MRNTPFVYPGPPPHGPSFRIPEAAGGATTVRR